MENHFQRQTDALSVIRKLIDELKSINAEYREIFTSRNNFEREARNGFPKSKIALEKLERFSSRSENKLMSISEFEAEKFRGLAGIISMTGVRETFESRVKGMTPFLDVLFGEIKNHPEDFFESNEQKFSGSTLSLGVDELKSLHPEVIKTAGKLFQDGHYRQAILDTYIGLVEAVQEKSGRNDLDGSSLMQHVFSKNKPILKVSNEPDEQAGFMWLFSGAVMGVRNPKAHSLLSQDDPQRALEWLSFASVLFRVLDDAELVERK